MADKVETRIGQFACVMDAGREGKFHYDSQQNVDIKVPEKATPAEKDAAFMARALEMAREMRNCTFANFFGEKKPDPKSKPASETAKGTGETTPAKTYQDIDVVGGYHGTRIF